MAGTSGPVRTFYPQFHVFTNIHLVVSMELSLSRVDYLQVGLTNPKTTRLLPVTAAKEQQKVEGQSRWRFPCENHLVVSSRPSLVIMMVSCKCSV